MPKPRRNYCLPASDFYRVAAAILLLINGALSLPLPRRRIQRRRFPMTTPRVLLAAILCLIAAVAAVAEELNTSSIDYRSAIDDIPGRRRTSAVRVGEGAVNTVDNDDDGVGSIPSSSSSSLGTRDFGERKRKRVHMMSVRKKSGKTGKISPKKSSKMRNKKSGKNGTNSLSGKKSSKKSGKKSSKKSSKKSGKNLISKSQPMEVKFVFDTVYFEVDVICGSLEDVKENIERAFKLFFDDERDMCDVDRNVRVLNLVEWEEASSCKSGKQGWTKGRLNRKSLCRKCVGRRELESLRGEGSGLQHLFRRRSSSRSRKRPHRDSTFESDGFGSGGGLLTGLRLSQVSLPLCEADLAAKLRSTGFMIVTTAKITDIVEADCFPGSLACSSDENGVCCGVEGCPCGAISSISLCHSEACCVEESSPFDPCFCADVGPCRSRPCGPRYLKCENDNEGTSKPTEAPIKQPDGGPPVLCPPQSSPPPSVFVTPIGSTVELGSCVVPDPYLRIEWSELYLSPIIFGEQYLLWTARLTYAGQAWLGLGVPEERGDCRMTGGDAVVGEPDLDGGGTARMHALLGKVPRLVIPFPLDSEILVDTEVTQTNIATTLTFTRVLYGDANEISLEEENVFLWAYGIDNDLGFHQGKGCIEGVRFSTIQTTTPTTTPTTVTETELGPVLTTTPSLEDTPRPSLSPERCLGTPKRERICADVRYVEWSDLDADIRDNALFLGYTNESWNIPGEADVEFRSWENLSPTEANAAFAMGFSETSWDCHISHYEDYSWEALDAVGVRRYYASAGWNQARWEENNAPPHHDDVWSMLTNIDREALTEVCFFEETWNGDPLSEITDTI